MLDADNKYLVCTNTFEDEYLLDGVSWELEEELEKQNIRIVWTSNDQGNRYVVDISSTTDAIDEKQSNEDLNQSVDGSTFHTMVCDICGNTYVVNDGETNADGNDSNCCQT